MTLMITQKSLSSLGAGLLLAIQAGFSGLAQAGTLWWDGASNTVNSASDNATTTAQNWLSGGNWDDGSTSQARASWTAGDHAVFGGSAASQTITAGTLTIGNLTFGGGDQGATEGTVPAYTLSSGTLTLSSPSTVTVNTPTVISSVLAGSAKSLIKSGNGTLILSGANTYAGSTTIESGTLQIGNNGTSGSLASSGVSVSSGGTLAFRRSAEWTFSNNISGNGVVTNIGAGNVVLTGSNSFSGTIMVAGRVTVNGANALAGEPRMYVNGNLTIGVAYATVAAKISELSGTTSGSIDGTFGGGNDTRTLAINQASSTTYAGTISDSTSSRKIAIIKSGAGTLTLSGTSAHTGGTTIKEGALKITGSVAGNILVDTNGTLVLGKVATFANAISGTGVIKSSLAGEVILSGNNTFSGALQVDSGTRIILNGTGADDGLPKLFMNGGEFTVGQAFVGGVATFSELSGTGEINPSYNNGTPRTLSVNQATSTTYTGTIVSTSSRWIGLAKSGPGTLILAGGANDINPDDITVSGGTLQVGAAEASITLFDQSHARTITVATNGTLRMLYRNAFGTVPSTPTTKLVIDGGTVTSSTGSSGAVTILQDLTLRNGGVLEVTKTPGSYGTYQLQGVVSVSGSSASMITNTGSTGWLTVGNGNNNTGVTIFDVADVTGNADTDLTIAAVIKDSGPGTRVGALTKAGSGTLLLLSTNLYTGTTTVSNGTLRLGINNALTATNSMTLAGGTLDAGSTTNTLGVLTLNADSALNMNADGKLSFAKSSTESWTGTLSLTGTIDFNRLRVGEDSTGLTSEQLGKIRYNGYGVGINAAGYLYVLRGTLIRFQ
jgi:autotransporter-associated beta strand protein